MVKPNNSRLHVKHLQRDNPNEPYHDAAEMARRASDITPLNRHIFRRDNEEPATHCLFRVRLKGGQDDYAIDVANGNYGYSDTVIPWGEYLAQRIARIVYIKPLTIHNDSVDPIPDLEAHIREIDLTQFNTFRMKHLVETWLQSDQFTYQTLIAEKKSTFPGKLAELEDYVTRGLAKSFPDAKEAGDLVMRMLEDREERDIGSYLAFQYDRRVILERNGLLQAAEGVRNPFRFSVKGIWV